MPERIVVFGLVTHGCHHPEALPVLSPLSTPIIVSRTPSGGRGHGGRSSARGGALVENPPSQRGFQGLASGHTPPWQPRSQIWGCGSVIKLSR